MKLRIGRYVHRESWIHGLDPRTKLMALGVLGAGVFFLNHWHEYALWAIVVLLLAGLAKLSWSEWSQGLFAVSLLMAVSFFLQLAFTPGEVLVQLGPITFTRQGLVSGANLVGRLAFFATFSALLAFTTTSAQLSQGLYVLMGGLKRQSVFLRRFALVAGLSARFVPLLFAQGEQVLKAQKARGIDFSQGSLFQRVRRIITLFVPLFHASLERANQLSMAMTARGYRLEAPHSHWKILVFSQRDWAALAIVSIFLTLVIFWQ